MLLKVKYKDLCVTIIVVVILHAGLADGLHGVAHLP